MKGPFDHAADSDLLDQVLGASPLPEPDAWFTARTLARCRTSRPEPRVTSFALARFWPRWAMLGIVVLASAGVTLQQTHRIHSLHLHRQHRVQEAFEVMATMGKDKDKDKDSSDTSWQDSSL
jgi:hypothetical protein